MAAAIDAALFGKDVTDKYVYHYTKREAAIEKILTAGKIRMNLLENTNDPREYKDWGITVTGGSEDDSPFWQARDLVNHKRKNQTKVFCLTLDDPRRLGMMRRGFARSRMWAQYGEKHTGMCLVFDKNGLESAIRKIVASADDCYFGPVVYSDQDTSIDFDFNTMGETDDNIQNGVEQYIRSNIQSLFFTKLKDWRDEIEYRAMVYDDRKEAVFVPVVDCLKGIILGADFPQVYVSLVQQMGSEVGAEIAQIGWREGIPYIRHMENWQAILHELEEGEYGGSSD